MTVVLISVFVPLAFFSGAIGNIYRQFAAVMVSAIAFSAFLALSLTPALCATLLKPVEAGHHIDKRGFFGWFNRRFARTAKGYEGWVAKLIHRGGRMLIVYIAVIGAATLLFRNLPTSFVPNEDQGSILVNVQLPPGATQQRTLAVMQQAEDYLLKQPEVESMVSVVGFSFAGSGQNAALGFVTLKPWDERHGAEHSAQGAGAAQLRRLGQDPRRRDLPGQPAAHPRPGPRQRLRVPPAGPQRPHARRAAGRAQPAAGCRRQEPAAGRGAARRPGGRRAARTAASTANARSRWACP